MAVTVRETEEVRFLTTPLDASVLEWVMSKEGWHLAQVVEASLEAFRIFRDYAGHCPELPVPLWLPSDHDTRGCVPYWEPAMGDEERSHLFHGVVVSPHDPLRKGFWEDLRLLSCSSLPNLFSIHFDSKQGRLAYWTLNQVLIGGAAMLARGLREDQKHSRLVVAFSREGLFGRELELWTRIFPNTVRWHSLLA